MNNKLSSSACTLCWLLLMVISCSAAPSIIPLPQQMQLRNGTFTLCPATTSASGFALAPTKILASPGSFKTGQYLAALLSRSTGFLFPVEQSTSTTSVKGTILLTDSNGNTNLASEGYELTVAADSVVVSGRTDDGVFYGVQTLLQLLPPQILAWKPAQGIAWTAPCVYVWDSPRFTWRGCMVDSVRHFFTKDEIKSFMDSMALLKLNRFHWHLADDQGWRVEILKYPLFAQVGAWRDAIDWGLNPRASGAWSGDDHYGGYYSQADIREIVAYAQSLHMIVVPEIEMPGHSTAAASAYPQYFCDPTLAYDTDTAHNGPGVFCPARPETMPFLQDVLTEILDLFPSPYIHIGGDEVNFSYWSAHSLDQALIKQLGLSSWQAYQSHFTQQIADWIHNHGRLMVGWSEIQNGGILTNAVCMDWLNTKATATAKAGQYVVMTPTSFCYYNYYEYTTGSYVWSTEPPGQGGSLSLATAYSFEPNPSGLASQYTNMILGAQANLWGEYFPSSLNLEFRAYPRLCAMAEVVWTAPTLKNYTNFAQRVTIHEQRLSQMGINYNHGSVPRIGTWVPPVTSNSYSTLQWDVTTNITSSGEVDVSFLYTTGNNGLDIAWTSLLENGIEIDRDSHAGFAGFTPTNAVYVLRLPAHKRNATYLIQSSVQGRGGTNSAGNVYLPNWN